VAEGGVDLRDEVQEIEEVMLGRWEASSIYIKCLGRSGSCVPERMTDLSYLFKGMRVAGHEAELGCQFHLSRQGHSSTRVGGGVGAGYQGYLDTLSLKGGARGGKGCALIAKEGGVWRRSRRRGKNACRPRGQGKESSKEAAEGRPSMEVLCISEIRTFPGPARL